MATAPFPRIQCSTGPFWAFELEAALDALAEAGFEEIELMVTRDPSTQEPELPARLAAERGLRIASVHGPFLVITKTVWGAEPVQKIRRGVEFCKAVGAETFVVHPPYLWEREFARWVTDDCAAFSATNGVTVAVETMFPKWVAGRRVRVHRWLHPQELLRAAPAVAIDTSHLAVLRHDIIDAYRLLEPKLVHVHLSDNAGDGRDGHLPIDQGVLPIERFLAELGRSRYAGAVSLELAVHRFIEKPTDLVQMLRRNREHVVRGIEGARVEKGMPR